MGNFQGGNNGGGGYRGGNGGGRSNFRGGDREVTMHKATCDECKKGCEVPFRPSGDKPVYCSDCFSSKRNDENRGGDRNFDNRAPKRDFNNNRSNNTSNQQPVFSKIVGSSDETKKLLAEMNTKLDRLINAIEKLSQPKMEVKPVAKIAPVVVKKVEVKKTPTLNTIVKKAIASKTPIKKVVAKKVITKKKK